MTDMQLRIDIVFLIIVCTCLIISRAIDAIARSFALIRQPWSYDELWLSRVSRENYDKLFI